MEELQLWRTRCATPGLSAEDPIIVVHPPLIALEKLIQLESMQGADLKTGSSWGSSCPWGTGFQECKLYTPGDEESHHADCENLEDEKPCGSSSEKAAGMGTSVSSRLRGPCARIQGCRGHNQCQEFHLAAAFCSRRGALLVLLLLAYISVQQVLSSLALFPEAAAQTAEGVSVQLAASKDARTEDDDGIKAARYASIIFYELCGCLGFVFLALLAASVTWPDKVRSGDDSLRVLPSDCPAGATPPPLPLRQLALPPAPQEAAAVVAASLAPADEALVSRQRPPEAASPETSPPPPETEWKPGQCAEGTSPSTATPCTPDAEAAKVQAHTVAGGRSRKIASSILVSVGAVTIISVGLRISYRLCSLAVPEDSVHASVADHGTLLSALGVADAVAAGLGPLLVVFLVAAQQLLPNRCAPFSVAILVFGTMLLQIAANIVPLMLSHKKASLCQSHWTIAVVAGAAVVTAIAAAGGDAATSERPGAAACWVFVWGSCTLFLSNHLIVVIAPLLATKKLLQAQGVLLALLITWAALSSPMVSLMRNADCKKELPVRCYFILHLLLSIYSRLVFIEAAFPSTDFAVLLVLMCCLEFAQVSGFLTFGRAWLFQRCHHSTRSKERQAVDRIDEQPETQEKEVDEKSALSTFDRTWWLLRCETEAWMQGFASLIADIVAIAVATSENLLEVVHGRCLPEDCTQSDVSPPLTPTSEQIMRRWLFAALGTVLVASRFTQWLAGHCRRQNVQRLMASGLEGAECSGEFNAKLFFRQNYVWLVVCVGVVVVPAIGQAPMELQAIRQTGKE